MTEEERAALFRRQAQARQDNARARWVALKGDPQMYQRLRRLTETLIEDPGWDPIDRGVPDAYT